MWRRWIKKRGVSKVAKELGVNTMTVYYWLNKRSLPSDKNKKKLIKISRGAIGPGDFFR